MFINSYKINKSIKLIIISFANIYYSQDKAEAALKKFEENFPQEKIHLLLNKQNYVVGENIWFTSFVFDGYNPSDISTNIFVELYDHNKVPISKKIYPIIQGKGSGSITLPENLKEDIYYLRAYTTWMGNFSEDFNAIKHVAIYNPSSQKKLIKNTESVWTASVIPESGTFIDGINTKFAVRLKSDGETPEIWNGYITEVQNPENKIVSFKGFDQNVGTFSLTPSLGKNYLLNIEDAQGKKQTINLPEVSSSGINLKVESHVDAIKFTLKGKNIKPESKYKVLGTINNQLVFKAIITNITDKVYSIPTQQLVNGIINLTVFDEQEKIIAQRLSFVQPQKLKINKPSLQNVSLNNIPKTKNYFKIPKNNGIPQYTVSISDAETENSEEENNLLSTLWLTGDIKSKIYKPSRYFNEKSNHEALDALMISEKWMRFNWQNLISGTFPIVKNKPEKYISYKGKVMKQGKPLVEDEVNLIFKNSNQGTQFHQIKTDKEGFFKLDGLIFEDTLNFSYQANNEKASKNSLQMYFQPNFSFLPLKNNLPTHNYNLVDRLPDDKIPNEINRAIENKNYQSLINEKYTLIEEVKLKGKNKNLTKKLNNELSGPLFKSGNEEVFDFVNENTGAQASINILQWLQGRVAGLQIQNQGGNNYSATYRGDAIGIFLDEMRIEASQISSIPVSNIAMVKVIKGYFAGSFGGGNGAIAIYTRRGTHGNSIDSTLPSVLTDTKLKGYDKEIEFNNAIYEDESTKNFGVDRRDTLYWNPYLERKPQESFNIEWYNNDEAKKFRAVIIGFDQENNVLYYYNDIIK